VVVAVVAWSWPSLLPPALGCELSSGLEEAMPVVSPPEPVPAGSPETGAGDPLPRLGVTVPPPPLSWLSAGSGVVSVGIVGVFGTRITGGEVERNEPDASGMKTVGVTRLEVAAVRATIFGTLAAAG
jgi:hypothetical protein